jgi:hypothetical protein
MLIFCSWTAGVVDCAQRPKSLSLGPLFRNRPEKGGVEATTYRVQLPLVCCIVETYTGSFKS